MTLLVTGASGFVGRAIVAQLARDERSGVRAAMRTVGPSAGDVVQVESLGPDADWRAALTGCTAVVHSAARVHMMQETAGDPVSAYRATNVAGTMALARQAAEAGVRRFVFLSSIKVNGESTVPGRPFRADDAPAPRDPYGVSKAEAEDALRAFSATSGMEVSIIRPVLVYGPGVKANFASMLRWLQRGVPLPLAMVDNARSLVALDNLVDLVRTVLVHPAAAGRTFLVSDDNDVSIAELLRRAARAMGTTARLLPVPPALLLGAASLLGRGAAAQRLLGSLQVDIGPTRAQLGWAPVVAMDEALRRTVAGMRGVSP